jgi:hypothetical protein
MTTSRRRFLPGPAGMLPPPAQVPRCGNQVLLALCGQQARAGHDKDFRYSISQIIKATGLHDRAVGMALNILDKHGLIQRYKQAGPAGNRYRIVGEQPAPANSRKPQPKPQSKTKKNELAKKPLLQVKPADLFEG